LNAEITKTGVSMESLIRNRGLRLYEFCSYHASVELYTIITNATIVMIGVMIGLNLYSYHV